MLYYKTVGTDLFLTVFNLQNPCSINICLHSQGDMKTGVSNCTAVAQMAVRHSVLITEY